MDALFFLDLTKFPRELPRPGLGWNPGIPLSVGVPKVLLHTPSLALTFGDKVPFKIPLSFPFISLGWVFEGFSGTGHGQSTSLGWARFSWINRTRSIPGKAQRAQSWTKQDFGFSMGQPASV